MSYRNFVIGNGHSCPCVKDCPNRRAGCRKTCEAFISYEVKRLAGEKGKVKK